MQEIGKHFLLGAKVFALMIVSLSSAAYALQYARSVKQSSYQSFSVTGEGEVVSVPDTAQFSASVVTNGGNDVADLQRQNTEKMNKVIDFLKANNIDTKDIKTDNYSVNPNYDYPVCISGKTCPSPRISGYTVMQGVTVKVRDAEKVGSILSGIVENGANSVSGISFVADDESKARNEAIAKAIASARKEAASIAKAGGFRLGRLISVQEDRNDGVITPMAYGMGGVAEDGKQAAPSPVIEPGSNTTKVKMTLVYEIR